MGLAARSRRLGYLLAASIVSLPLALPARCAAQHLEPPAVATAMARYRRDVAQYQTARADYEAAADAYWRSIVEKRRLRAAKRADHQPISLDDYVLTQPPVYRGPPKPRNPSQPQEQAPPAPAVYIPVVADFLAAAQHEFKFAPRLPQSESQFKRAYAEAALAAGLTRKQIVRIYSFEAGGNGDYDVQAGLEYNKRARAITTALGYNQLLATNSVEIIAESGNRFIKSLLTRAASLPDSAREALDDKIAIVRKMVGVARSVPDQWSRHQALANTPKGLGIHAMNLDLDVGPLLQTQKLMDSIVFARRKGVDITLSAAELEMMNLTGDGNGFDMITMPPAWRDEVPTANFFQRSGYDDNPVAQRNNVVGRLIAATDARMDEEARKPGAQQLAAALR